MTDTQKELDNAKAEIAKLRPVVEAARLMFMAIDQGDEDARRIAYLELRDALAALDMENEK